MQYLQLCIQGASAQELEFVSRTLPKSDNKKFTKSEWAKMLKSVKPIAQKKGVKINQRSW